MSESSRVQSVWVYLGRRQRRSPQTLFSCACQDHLDKCEAVTAAAWRGEGLARQESGGGAALPRRGRATGAPHELHTRKGAFHTPLTARPRLSPSLTSSTSNTSDVWTTLEQADRPSGSGCPLLTAALPRGLCEQPGFTGGESQTDGSGLPQVSPRGQRWIGDRLSAEPHALLSISGPPFLLPRARKHQRTVVVTRSVPACL